MYLSSVTVFGQHGSSQRTEFSVPLLSLGQNAIARVAFDSWPDLSQRGKERPFFLAFLTDQSAIDLLKPHLDSHIFRYLDLLKEKKTQFLSQDVWNSIIKAYSTSTDKEEETFIINSLETDIEYPISGALKDLEIATSAWENLKDRNQLWTALRVANRLEHVDDKVAGEAFSLVGEIFLESNNFQESLEVFEKASDAFSRVRMYDKAGENSWFAGKCAYQKQEYNKAVELLQTAIVLVKDPKKVASINYDMGVVFHEQLKFDQANACFEKAVKLALETSKHNAAVYSSTYASKLHYQYEIEKNSNPTLSMGLLRRSAEQREKTAQYLQMINEGYNEAATSLILAANAYFELDNNKKGINLLERASDLFIEGKEPISAAKSLYDGANRAESPEKSISLLKKALSIIDQKEINTHGYRILGSIYYEKGRIEDKNKQTIAACESFNYSLRNLKKSGVPVANLIPVQIQYANALFRMEDFEASAELFLSGVNGFSTLPPTDNIIQQQNNALNNALISLRRASTIYHNAGIVALRNNDETHSINFFTRSTSLLIDWSEKNTISNHEKITKVLADRITTLSLKDNLLVLAESKYKLNSLIESLKMTLTALKK